MRQTPAEPSALLHELLERTTTLFAARVGPDGVVRTANDALETWAGGGIVGSTLAELLTAPQRPALQQALEDAGEQWTALTLGFTDGSPRPASDRRVFLRRDGDAVLVVAEPAAAERDRLVEQVLELNEDLITAQRGLSRRQRELERAQAEAAAAAERVRRLESIMLAGLRSPDLEGLLAALLDVAREVFRSDRATVLLRHEDRRHLYVAAAIGLAPEVQAKVRVPLGRGFAGTIAATGQARLVPDTTKAEIWSAYLRESGGSVAGVPLVLEDEVIGVLHVSSLQADFFTADDLALLERVGERAALAIGHAQLRERERAVAEALQRSLLPERLPVVPGVALAARYLSRATGVHVGGDFYDAVRPQDGELGLSIGDVAGKGLHAAATMGRLRNALRAYAFDGVGPAELLRLLDRLVVDEDTMATAQHLWLDPQTGRLRFASAGHPPALRVCPDGTHTWLRGALGPPLGTAWERVAEAEAEVVPGERLLLFTDGLVERRTGTLDDGLALLAEVAADARAEDLEAWCDAVLERMVASTDGGFEDDVALLAVERLRA
jgi:serine phosphatase RsbU (regulator of sigma subunit)